MLALAAQDAPGPQSQARADGVAGRRLGHRYLFYLIGTFLSITILSQFWVGRLSPRKNAASIA
jgi:hypothetical protein